MGGSASSSHSGVTIINELQNNKPKDVGIVSISNGGTVQNEFDVKEPVKSSLSFEKSNKKFAWDASMTECIENFLVQGLVNVTGSNDTEKMDIIFRNERARAAFLTFMESEMKPEDYALFEAVKVTSDDAATENLVSTYLTNADSYVPPDFKKTATSLLMLGESTDNGNVIIDEVSKKRQSDVLTVMTMGLFPKFIESDIYKKWRAQELLYIYDEVNAVDNVIGKTIASQAFATMEDDEVRKLSFCSSWLKHLIGAVESLPVCVSISTADRNRMGFPLIYVNGQFEKVTGYARSEIIGRNCSFLQGPSTEPESVRQLGSALKNAAPVKVEITNFRKDKTKFTNLLAMKPIFDNTGQYRYVVGLQFSLDQGDASASHLKFANQMLRMLPDIIFLTQPKKKG